MESIWVAAEMRAGGAYAHSTLALHALDALDALDSEPSDLNADNLTVHRQAQ